MRISSFTKAFWKIVPHKCNTDIEFRIRKLYFCSKCGRNTKDVYGQYTMPKEDKEIMENKRRRVN
jgi:hypothetical protein